MTEQEFKQRLAESDAPGRIARRITIAAIGAALALIALAMAVG